MTKIARINGYFLRAPIDEPVVNAFGRMDARQTLLVRIEDDLGGYGWGEIWCNFPAWGGAHRARLLEHSIGPWYLGRSIERPEITTRSAYRHFHKMWLQCGERGPFSNVLAGIDCALWDLTARNANTPLVRSLGGKSRAVPAYASGINPSSPMKQIEDARNRGYGSFKLKIGFANDDENLDFIGKELTGGEQLFVDVNQGYDDIQAMRRLPELAARGVGWIEEPVAADTSRETWRELAQVSSAPLAGGENIAGLEHFEEVIGDRVLGVVQPDLAKWGGHSLCKPVALLALKSGLRYCPHYLGGGIGLLHSAHLLGAVGGDGLLEVDCNENPLRTDLVECPALNEVGLFSLADKPGIGIDPSAAVISSFQEMSFEIP